MAKRFESDHERDAFLGEPRLAILMYQGPRPSPTGVPVWYDWDGKTLRMFAGKTSAKIERLQQNPNVSVLVTNRVGEPEAWVAFDGVVSLSEFEAEDWHQLIDRVAPRYWDMESPDYANEIATWRSSPESFMSLSLNPEAIRSGR